MQHVSPESIARSVPSLEAHNRVNGPDTGRNSGGREIKNIINAYNYSSDIKM